MVTTVDYFNKNAGYGFIDLNDPNRDGFFHMADIGGPDVRIGQKVTYDIGDTVEDPNLDFKLVKNLWRKTSDGEEGVHPNYKSAGTFTGKVVIIQINGNESYGFIQGKSVTDPILFYDGLGSCQELKSQSKVEFEMQKPESGPPTLPLAKNITPIENYSKDSTSENTRIFPGN